MTWGPWALCLHCLVVYALSLLLRKISLLVCDLWDNLVLSLNPPQTWTNPVQTATSSDGLRDACFMESMPSRWTPTSPREALIVSGQPTPVGTTALSPSTLDEMWVVFNARQRLFEHTPSCCAYLSCSLLKLLSRIALWFVVLCWPVLLWMDGCLDCFSLGVLHMDLLCGLRLWECLHRFMSRCSALCKIMAHLQVAHPRKGLNTSQSPAATGPPQQEQFSVSRLWPTVPASTKWRQSLVWVAGECVAWLWKLRLCLLLGTWHWWAVYWLASPFQRLIDFFYKKKIIFIIYQFSPFTFFFLNCIDFFLFSSFFFCGFIFAFFPQVLDLETYIIEISFRI